MRRRKRRRCSSFERLRNTFTTGKAVLDEEALPVVDLAVAALPDVVAPRARRELLALEDLRVDAHDEDVLVVRPVEDRDLAARRQLLRVAPEVVVVELLRRRRPEAVDDDALRVHAAHHVPDRAVLAARVERLEHHEHAVGVLCGEPRLVVGEERRRPRGAAPCCPPPRRSRRCSRGRSPVRARPPCRAGHGTAR